MLKGHIRWLKNIGKNWPMHFSYSSCYSSHQVIDNSNIAWRETLDWVQKLAESWYRQKFARSVAGKKKFCSLPTRGLRRRTVLFSPSFLVGSTLSASVENMYIWVWLRFIVQIAIHLLASSHNKKRYLNTFRVATQLTEYYYFIWDQFPKGQCEQ